MFRGTTWFATLAIILLLFLILYEIGKEAVPAMGKYGLSFLTSQTWDANKGHFGILPQIWGTLYSSFLALLIGGGLGVAVAIFLTQDFLPAALQAVFKSIVELLAAIPSVVYGLWGIFVLIPLIRPYCDWIYAHFSWIPFFGTTLAGPGMLPAALVLAIMILPTVAAVSQDALLAIPYKVKEAVYGMGTTRWEAIFKVMLPTASHGIFGALVLGLRPGPGGNHGARHVGGELQPDQPVPVFAGQHPGGAPGLELPRSRQGGNPGPHVRGHHPPGDHPHCQRHRAVHHQHDQPKPG